LTDRIVYADSSALVKLIVEEAESCALEGELSDDPTLVSSALARVEVARAVRIQTRGDAVAEAAAARLVASCRLVPAVDEILERATALATRHLGTLDAIHLASALTVAPHSVVTYDRGLAEAAVAARLRVVVPGRGGV
jgi:predicted nucleic acid-binding protein